MTDTAVITSPYKVQPSEYALHLLRLWVRNNWWVFALPVIVSLALAAAIDLKFIFIAVVVCFLVMPHALFVVWTNHALSPVMRFSILFHRCIVTPGEDIRVEFVVEATDGEDDASKPSSSVRVPDPVVIPWTSIRKIRKQKDSIIYHLASGRYDILIIPRSACRL